MVLERPGRIDGVTLPAAEGGDGEFTYSLTGLPRGLSFDPDTRTLSGIVTSGRYALTYTATDEAGVKDALSFVFTVQAAPSEDGRSVRSRSGGVTGQSEDIDHRRPNIRNLSVERKPYSEPAAPGLNVAWNPPDMSQNSSGETDLTIEQYELRYTKFGTGLFTYAYMSEDSRRTSLTGLVAGANYKVDMRVKYSGERYPEWTFFNRTTNTPPRLAAGSLNPTYILELGGSDSVQRIDDEFTDPNGDTLTYKASSTPAGIVTATIEDGEEDGNPIKNLRIHLLNPITGAANVTYGAHDGYGGYVFQVISVGGFANVTRSVAENSAADTDVGDLVTGTPYGTETLTYTLTGETATSGAFEIDSATGQISVAEGATLDHEAKSSYTGKVNWTVNGAAAAVNLTIDVTDVNEPPLAPVNPKVTDISDTGFTVTWEAPDNSGRPAITEFELKSEAPDGTATTQKTSDGTTYSISVSSLEPGASYELTLTASNAEGKSPAATFTAATTDYRPSSADFTKYFKEGENAAFRQHDFQFSSEKTEETLAHVKFTSEHPVPGGPGSRQNASNGWRRLQAEAVGRHPGLDHRLGSAHRGQ